MPTPFASPPSARAHPPFWWRSRLNAARLSFVDVACVRAGRLIFRGQSFALEPGDALVLAGPNGAGKSSLIRVAAGLIAPFAGQVERQGNIALVDEHPALEERRPLAGALRFWAGIDQADDAGVIDALARMKLDQLAEVPVHMLSTGQRRRAGFARLLVSAAPIWLLDEPGNGLDSTARQLLEAEVARHRAAGGIALIATHLPIDLPGAETRLMTPLDGKEGTSPAGFLFDPEEDE